MTTTRLVDVRNGDWGTHFLATLREPNEVTGKLQAVDLRAAVTMSIIFKKPDGTLMTKSASFPSGHNGSDGMIQYATAAGELNQDGTWYWQLYVTFSTGAWKSDYKAFRVAGNLSAT
jgi:hypothetical protein